MVALVRLQDADANSNGNQKKKTYNMAATNNNVEEIRNRVILGEFGVMNVS